MLFDVSVPEISFSVHYALDFLMESDEKRIVHHGMVDFEQKVVRQIFIDFIREVNVFIWIIYFEERLKFFFDTRFGAYAEHGQ